MPNEANQKVNCASFLFLQFFGARKSARKLLVKLTPYFTFPQTFLTEEECWNVVGPASVSSLLWLGHT